MLFQIPEGFWFVFFWGGEGRDCQTASKFIWKCKGPLDGQLAMAMFSSHHNDLMSLMVEALSA